MLAGMIKILMIHTSLMHIASGHNNCKNVMLENVVSGKYNFSSETLYGVKSDVMILKNKHKT